MKKAPHLSGAFRKAFLILSGFLLWTFPLSVWSQGDTSLPEPRQHPDKIVKSNPLTTIWGTLPFTAQYRLGVERILGREMTTQLDISYLGKSPLLRLVEDSLFQRTGRRYNFRVSGWSIRLWYKWYLTGLMDEGRLPRNGGDYAPWGYYISAYFSHSYAHLRPRSLNNAGPIDLRMRHTNVNLVIGQQYLVLDRVSMDVWLGLGWKQNTWHRKDHHNRIHRVPQDEMMFYGGDYRLSTGLSIGYYW